MSSVCVPAHLAETVQRCYPEMVSDVGSYLWSQEIMMDYHLPAVEEQMMSLALEMWRDGLKYDQIVQTFRNSGMPKATAEYFAISTVPLQRIGARIL